MELVAIGLSPAHMETFDTVAQIVDNRSSAVSLPANRQL
jgi:hypothetical protein